MRWKDYWLGVMSVITMFGLMGLTQINNKFTDPNIIAQEFQNIYDKVQPKQWRRFTSTPTYTQLEDNETIWFTSNLSSVPRYEVFRDGTTLYYILASTK